MSQQPQHYMNPRTSTKVSFWAPPPFSSLPQISHLSWPGYSWPPHISHLTGISFLMAFIISKYLSLLCWLLYSVLLDCSILYTLLAVLVCYYESLTWELLRQITRGRDYRQAKALCWEKSWFVLLKQKAKAWSQPLGGEILHPQHLHVSLRALPGVCGVGRCP